MRVIFSLSFELKGTLPNKLAMLCNIEVTGLIHYFQSLCVDIYNAHHYALIFIICYITAGVYCTLV